MSDQRFVESPPGGADGWREVWQSDARYRPRPSAGDWFLSIFRRLFRRVTAVDAELKKERELMPVTAKRNDALIAAIDQKIESISARLHDLTLPVISGGQAGAPVVHDFLYRRLEDGLRGTPDVAPYLDLARTHQPAI